MSRSVVGLLVVVGLLAAACGASPVDGNVGTGSSELTLTPTQPPTCKTPLTVLVLSDTDGKYYGLGDGYRVPFPTPWITTGDEADYERLIATDTGHLAYEYLVENVTMEADGKFFHDRTDPQYFLVPWAQNGSDAVLDPEYEQLYRDVYQTPADGYASFSVVPDVEASALGCVLLGTSADGVHFTPVDGPSVAFPSGGYFPFADRHDPSHHPD